MLLQEVKNNIEEKIYDRILFCVIQSGTSLKNGINTGNYNNDRLKNMISVTKKYNKLSKEHNGDYMDKNIMISRFNTGLDSLNIAPELGVFETKIILNELIQNNDNDNINLFYKLCFESGKWKKWVSKDFNPEENKHKLIEICGHYVFTQLLFLNNYKNLKINILTKLNNKLHKTYEYINPYYNKEWLKNIIRIHPPKESQEINNNRLRQHTERLTPFSEDFFKFFKNS